MSKQLPEMNKDKALFNLAHSIIEDGKEFEDYVDWCYDNELDPANIQGEIQRGHIYAQALIGLELEYMGGFYVKS